MSGAAFFSISSMKRGGWAVFAIGLAALTACAGFRSSTMAAPYFEGSAPPTDQPGTIYEIDQTRTLTQDGLSLTLRLGEESLNSDVQVMLAVVPTSIKLGDKPDTNDGADLTLTLDLYPSRTGVSIVPGHVQIMAGGQNLTPTQAVSSGRAVGLAERVHIGARGHASVTMRFAIPKDTPPEQVVLDLSAALGALPLIRFKTLRWHYGCT